MGRVQEFDRQARTGTGFVFEPYQAEAFLGAVDRAIAAYRQKDLWAALMQNAMSADFSWTRSARLTSSDRQ